MKLLPGIIALATVLTVAAKAPKDPVLMTVDGQPVTLSEFEYLYHKNADQQLEQETVDQYLQRFIDYKLKVAQARHERRDTTAEYQKDFNAYRNELATPYLTDTEMEQQIVDKSFSHMLEEVEVDHIMLPTDAAVRADSIRAAAVAAGTREAFLDLAKQFSIDPSLSRNGGKYDWIKAGVYPWEWEEAAYSTAVDSVSPVVATPYGLHILRVNARRPAKGDVHAAHILVSYDSMKGDTLAAKARIDSIYNIVSQHGIDFGEVARQVSDCPSKEQGGDLGFFARGTMVPEFDTMVFENLSDGEISKPFTTRFGYHIAKRIEEKKPNKRQAEPEIRAAMQRDGRAAIPRRARAEKLRKEYNVHYDEAGKARLLKAVADLGIDSVRKVLASDPAPLFYIADSTVTIGDFIASNPRVNPRQPQEQQISRVLENRLSSATFNYELKHLGEKYPEFRNVEREYAEGLMLFASMEDNVWNKPTTDPEGLKAYFEANREKYNDWESPRWKGYVIYAAEDSIIRQVEQFLSEKQPSAENLGEALKEAFPRNIKIERIVLPQGQNKLVDHIAFGGPAYTPTDRWKYYVTYLGHIIAGPEEVADVRGRVSNDWTEELEKQYMEQLRQRYPVVVNKKVLKKVK